MLTIVEHPACTPILQQIIHDDDYADLQADLAQNPETGKLIPGLGGLRSVERCGVTVLYLPIPAAGIIYVVHAFVEGDVSQITPEEKRRLLAAIIIIKKEEYFQ